MHSNIIRPARFARPRSSDNIKRIFDGATVTEMAPARPREGVSAPLPPPVTSRPTRHIVIQPSLFDRIGDALGSRVGLAAYLGFVAGCFFTVALAAVWAGAL